VLGGGGIYVPPSLILLVAVSFDIQPQGSSDKRESKLLVKIGAIFDQTLNFLAYVVGVLLVFGWLSVVADVVMRYFLNRPLTWALETTEYVLTTVAFLGAAWLLRREGHVSLDLVLNLFKPRTQAMFHAITSSLGAIACLIIVWYGVEATWSHYLKGMRVTTALAPPTAPFLTIIPVGFFLLFLQFLRRSYGYLLKWKAVPEKEEKRFEDLSEA